jgi:dienelactone hydrolase
MSSGRQDVFTVHDTPRCQMAVRDAAAHPGTYPLIIFSHPSSAHRRAATFLCTHLSSHGYVVTALDHSEVVAPELGPSAGETPDQKTARIQAVLGNRVPDIRFLLDRLLDNVSIYSDAHLDPTQIGIVGHSLGGWTALAVPDVERRICAVVALAPGGASKRKPGILPPTLPFAWSRDVPTLYLVAADDVSLKLPGMYELFERTPATKQMVILRRADHAHFMDNVEEVHEAMRKTVWSGELAWISRDMRPMSELCSGEQAHLFARGLTLAHMDATVRQQDEARRFLAGDLEAELAARGVDAIGHRR